MPGFWFGDQIYFSLVGFLLMAFPMMAMMFSMIVVETQNFASLRDEMVNIFEIIFINNNDSVNMIGHYHKRPQFYEWEMNGDFIPIMLGVFANRR